MFRFMHIGFMFPGVPKIRDLEPVITTVGDWIRYSPLSWIVWTDKQPAEIFIMIRPYLDPQDQVLIVGLNALDSFGSLSPWIWTWVNSKAPSITTGQDVQNLLLGPPPPPPKRY